MFPTYLKIKIMSLAAEARLIRREEQRWYGASELRQGLRNHRIYDVRTEARAALLAYGYVRGRTYAQLETSPLTPPRWDRVVVLARKYGSLPKLEVKDLETWAKPKEEVKIAA